MLDCESESDVSEEYDDESEEDFYDENNEHFDDNDNIVGDNDSYNTNNHENIVKDEHVADDHEQMACKSSENTSQTKDFLVDSGCTSHIVDDESSFVEFDQSFKPETHSLTLADGTKCSGTAEKRGKVDVILTDTKGVDHKVTLHDVLYIPSYPQSMFSVDRANKQHSSILFRPNSAHLIAPDNSTRFNIRKERGLFWLRARIPRRSKENVDSVKSVRDLKEWHSNLGHCNQSDILKLEPLVDGMTISKKDKLNCAPCALGKLTNKRNKAASERAKAPFEMVSSDVCGPVSPASTDGFRWVISLIDNYSGFAFVYFMKNKSDAAAVLRKFIADISPFGRIKVLLNLTSKTELAQGRM